MRILHTSDWHLGRSFHRVGLLDAQARFLDHLVEVVRAERLDAVVVSGDVYDRALPSVDAVEVLDDGLDRLLAAGATVLVTSGNHDSAQRLGFGARRAARAGLHLRTRLDQLDEPVLVSDRHGSVALYGLPWLEPTFAAPALDAERSHAGVLAAAMHRVRADLHRRPVGTRSLVAAHAFVVGGEASGSERDVAVGGVACAPASTFAGVDYAALGHLHGRQHLGGALRYSGSPLPYSFSEAAHRKGSWLVHLDADGVADVEAVEAPVHRQLATLRGRLDDLLTDSAHAAAERAFCQVVLTDAERAREPMQRLRARFPHTLTLAFEPEGAARGEATYADRVRGLDDTAVCCSFLEHVRGRPVPPVERALLAEALEAGRRLPGGGAATGPGTAAGPDAATGAAAVARGAA